MLHAIARAHAWIQSLIKDYKNASQCKERYMHDDMIYVFVFSTQEGSIALLPRNNVRTLK